MGSDRNEEQLPDLTPQLYEQGIHSEYIKHRRQYRQRCATVDGLIVPDAVADDDAYRFELWYPTPVIFRWRYTMAYWNAIIVLQGSLLITFSNGIIFVHKRLLGWSWIPGVLTLLPNALGALFFLVGSYAGYLQLINIPTASAEQLIYIVPNWPRIRARVGLESCVGELSYFIGMLFYGVACFLSLFFELQETSAPELVAAVFIRVPNLLGGAAFLVGGVCELLHNRIFRGGAVCTQAVWWASLANTVGGFCFLAASVPPLGRRPISLNARVFMEAVLFLGSLCYVLSSVCMILMWRANDLGLTLLKQLNLAAKGRDAVEALALTAVVAATPRADGKQRLRVRLAGESSNGVPPKLKFSLRGTFFIMVYCWFACAVMVNIIIRHLSFTHSYVQHTLRHAMDEAMQLVILGVIHLTLIVHSVVTSVPNEQPYRFAVIAGRAVLLAGAAAQTATMVEFLADPQYEVEDEGHPTSLRTPFRGAPFLRHGLAFLGATAARFAVAARAGQRCLPPLPAVAACSP